MTRAIRVVSINKNEGTGRLRLELRRNSENNLQWFCPEEDYWVDSYNLKSVKDAMDTVYSWYGKSPEWDLHFGCR